MPTPQHHEQSTRQYVGDLLTSVTPCSGRFVVLGGCGTLNALIQQSIAEGNISADVQAAFDLSIEKLVI